MGLFKKLGELLSDSEKMPENVENDQKDKNKLNAEVVENDETTGIDSASFDKIEAKESEQSQPEQQVEDVDKNGSCLNDCTEETRAAIKRAVLKSINAMYGFNRTACTDCPLYIYLNTANQMLFDAYINSNFDEELKEYLLNEADYRIGNVKLSGGTPDNGEKNKFANVNINGITLWYYIETIDNESEKSKEPKTMATRAVIRIAGGKGKLLQENYELTSEVNGFYNIGRGKLPMTRKGIRENHIVIDEEVQELNSFVSRSQARIGFNDQIGFYIQVEYEGSRLGGNRTRIYRNAGIIDLDNPAIQEPLHDGDIIELGKAVLLEYKEQK